MWSRTRVGYIGDTVRFARIIILKFIDHLENDMININIYSFEVKLRSGVTRNASSGPLITVIFRSLLHTDMPICTIWRHFLRARWVSTILSRSLNRCYLQCSKNGCYCTASCVNYRRRSTRHGTFCNTTSPLINHFTHAYCNIYLDCWLKRSRPACLLYLTM